MKNFIFISFLFLSVWKSDSVSLKVPNALGSIYQSSLISELKHKLKDVEFKSNISSFSDMEKAEGEFLIKSIVPSYVQDLLKHEEIQRIFTKDISPLQNSVNKVCSDHLSKLLLEIVNILKNPLSIVNASTWALQMIDAWGKIPEGVLSGHVNSYGDYDECVNLRAEENLGDLPNFKGQYCWTYILPTAMIEGSTNYVNNFRKAGSIPELIDNIANPVSSYLIPSIGVCLPSSCSMEEIQTVVSFLAKNLTFNTLTPIVSHCVTNDKPPLSTGAISMIVVLSVLGFIIMMGTGIDSILLLKDDFSRLRKSLPIQILLCFSLVTNIRKWQNTSSDGGFGCIHGIRFLSTCWVIMCHTVVGFTLQPPLWNLIDLNHIYDKNWTIYLILNGYFAVDTFFTMSGLLACLSILKALDKTNGRLNIFKLYLHRYLRITPTYVLLIGILATIYIYLGDGPSFIQNYAGYLSENCQRSWWHNILYINNVYPYNSTAGENMCEGESWYIANDMQFFILSPLFVYLLWKWQYVGMGVLGAASIASILVPGIKVGTEKLDPTLIYWIADLEVLKVYRQPQYRIGPYLVGMWMGYILFKIGKKPVKLPKLGVMGVWMISTSTALTLILGIIPFFYPDHKDNPVAAGFYAGFSKFCWGIVISWIIFACIKGYGGWVNSFLSMKVFIPLGRLTFCVYLSSFSVQMLLHTTARQPMVFDMYTVTNVFFSHLVMCFLVGFVLTMMFESPFIALEKILMGGGGGRSKVNNDQENINHTDNAEVNDKSVHKE